MDKFCRRIKLKTHFQDTRKQADLSDKEYSFKSKSKLSVPTKIHHIIDTFIKLTKKEIDEQLTKTKKVHITFLKRILKSSVTRQKGESQNGCFKKTKHAKFSEKRTFLIP